MSFITDKQTLEDLNIPGKYRPDSIFSLFNNVITRGGERLLEEMFRQPLTDQDTINERTGIFQYFASQSLQFPFSKDRFHNLEDYLGTTGNGNLVSTGIQVYRKKLMASVVRDEAYTVLHDQLVGGIELLNIFSGFLNALPVIGQDNPYLKQLHGIKNMFDKGCFKWIVQQRGVKKLSTRLVVQYDHLLRSAHAEEIKTVLDAIYRLDVYIAGSELITSKGFSLARALPRQDNRLSIVNFWHPSIEKPIGNTISMNRDGNVLFLTGANMAGKSTLMKSFGIAVYLAHMGFPVPADSMIFSVKDGIYSSINVPDDLNLGYSHFYAEVQRVKKVAQEISRPLELVIIFDELFKGTNVKDAYDATLAITEAFAEKKNCLFIISTHITEAGEQLRGRCSNLQFVYLPSILHGNKPVYTYQLQQGISDDRHGMIIIQQEGILELIEP
jgi:DNA mismatch repair protein MutS